MNQELSRWMSMSRNELDELYKQAKPGPIPQGETAGTVIMADWPFPNLLAKLAKLFAWQGKIFDMFAPTFSAGILVNKVTPLRLNLITAKVFKDKSWIDGQDTTVIDYSTTSLLASPIRDEIREVQPGLYLGKVWWGRRRILDFALEANK